MLDKDKVMLIDTIPNIDKILENETDVINKSIGEFLIFHVGSSSVGIPTKPIVDIVIPINNYLDKKQFIISKFNSIGYKYIGDKIYIKPWVADIFSNYYSFLVKDLEDVGIHLKLMDFKSDLLVDLLLFKHILLTNKQIREIYINIKNELSNLYGDDRTSYSIEKGKFIDCVLRRYRNEYK